ncbi:MAG: hypothetical protein U0798_03900 [Gemmataceae bacterium]
MKRILFAAAVAMALGVFASESKAQWGAPPVPGMQGPQAPVGPVGDRYGYNPMLRQLMWWKKDRCGSGACGGPAAGMQQGPGGTLVFPVNPYVRSPRDWFQN